MTSNLDGERTDILAGLASARHFLRFAARDLTDEQARQRTTVSELSLGGLIKHVAATEQGWATFILEGPSALGNYDDMSEADMTGWTDGFRLLPDETLAGVLEDYAKVAQRTDELVASLPDLNVSHPLPKAPWFPPGAFTIHPGTFVSVGAPDLPAPDGPCCGRPSCFSRCSTWPSFPTFTPGSGLWLRKNIASIWL